MMNFGQVCCLSCAVGAPVVRWQNITKVRPKGDTLPATYDAYDGVNYPYPRYNTDSYDADNPGAGCTTLNAGSCGDWLAGGDLNGVSAQVINIGTDDIQAPVAVDSTHVVFDHNSFLKTTPVTSGAFVAGQTYQITTIGTTDFTTIGATANNVGTVFTATGVGSGTGTAQPVADMRAEKLQGGQWIFAKKFFHGTLGLTSPDSCITDQPTLATYAPDMVKYLTINSNGSWNWTDSYLGNISGVAVEYQIETQSGGFTATRSVNQTSGIQTASTALTWDDYFLTGSPGDSLTHYVHLVNGAGFNLGLAPAPTTILSNGTANTTVGGTLNGDMLAFPNCTNDIPGVTAWVNYWNNAVATSPHPSGYDPSGSAIVIPSNPINGWSDSRSFITQYTDPVDSSTKTKTGTISIAVTRTNEEYTWSISMDAYWGGSPDAGYGHFTLAYSGSISLTGIYNKAMYEADLLAALDWDMSDLNLAKFRTDETLALAPCAMYDEVGPTSPVFSPPFTIDDLNSPINDINGTAPFVSTDPAAVLPYVYNSSATVSWSPTWTQINWLDPNNYIWKYPSGSTRTTGSLQDSFGSETAFAGAALITGMRTGEIISHSNAGFDRIFWPGYLEKRRQACTSPDPSGFTWEDYRNGGFSDPAIAATALRWLDNFAAQYDGDLCNPNAVSEGNYPQAFFRYGAGTGGGIGIAGKFVMASIGYNAVNYGRPCGADKFSVEQTSVCYVSDASSFDATTGGTLTVAPGAGITAPSSGYALVEGYGIYPITGLSGTTLTLGAQIDTLPTSVNCFPPELWGTDAYHGSGGFYVGKLRWIGYTNYGVSWTSAPGLCGRVPVTAAYASGTLTVTTATAQPYFRKGSDAALRPVNLYDTNWTKLNSSPLTMARTDDSHFTVAGANFPTAVWMIDAQFDSAVGWQKYTAASQKTGVLANWTFSRRDEALATPPTWFGGFGGVLTGGLTQFQYSSGACPAAIGIVPFYDAPMLGDSPMLGGSPLPAAEPTENFPNQELFPMPGFSTDESFGSHAQAAVMLSMVDPFFESPFKPDSGGTDSFSWVEDDGEGTPNDSGATPPVYYFPLAPMVEAAMGVPSTYSLPTGLYLPLDPAHNAVAPPYWATPPYFGIPTNAGDYGSVTTEWGTVGRVCANIAGSGRFSSVYATYGIQC